MKQETISIESPEKIRFDYNIAKIGTRIGAYLLDMLIQMLILFLVYLVFMMSGGLDDGPISAGTADEFRFAAAAFLYLIYFFFQWGYFTFFEIFRDGQSPGKRAMRISVIKSNGDPLDVPVIVLRNLLRAVDSFPTLHLLGGFVSIIDKKSRRLGDIVADTIVVHEIRFHLEEPRFDTKLSEKSTREPPLKLMTRLNEEELYIIRTFLGDRHKLTGDREGLIARKLAERIKQRLTITGRFPDDIVFLETVYREHTDEHTE